MKLYVRINLTDINLVGYAGDAKKRFETPGNQDTVLLTDPSSMPHIDAELCTRDGSVIKLCHHDKKNLTADIEYDDFVVGMNVEDRPPWFNILKDRIVATSGSEDYGPEQRLRVAESLVCGAAEARIRCVQSLWNRSGCVFVVKITAKGDHTSFEDALRLHAQILSGEAYE